MIYFCVAMAVATLGYFGWKLTSRNSYESAAYTVLELESPFELREYPDLMMATTEMQSEPQGKDGSFMKLFRYISGSNDRQQKVPMTTPVFMEPKRPKDKGQMGFVIPKKISEKHVPEPTNDNVQIRRRVGGRFAVIRFAGRSESQSVVKAEERLRGWMRDKEISGIGEAELASYDPPWTPGPLRRNEVLIRLK
ncbi:SOUL family heme-binding protein [Adhaeretor mobilis]|uniref:SOUL heme-binding protein n=1 Tax=Adhaeretor mobilis TaxID=1930276 RepID=A0A517MPR1_9BACT|nr:heme-binding protein [Adhaeretor mobilis]QDS96873.1 SOUL heme-binding protein [Adhaeretor mobilis]